MRYVWFHILTALLALACLPSLAAAESVRISEKLFVVEIADGVFLHTSDNNNGLVVISEGEAFAVSTPATAAQTEELIDWIRRDQGASLIGFAADRWHPDAMGGLETVHEKGVRSYAHNRTRRIARARGLAVAQVGFDARMEVQVGRKTLTLEYLGEAHTKDGVVAWVAEDNVLFGGNAVRNAGGWIGNIGDANLLQWSRTIERVEARYPDAVHVVPGHGKVGGPELLRYTIDLYDDFAKADAGAEALDSGACALDGPISVERAGSDQTQGRVRELSEAAILLQDAHKTIRIAAAGLKIDTASNRIRAPSGELAIYDKVDGACAARTDLVFDRLFAVEVDDVVGWAIVVEKAAPRSLSED